MRPKTRGSIPVQDKGEVGPGGQVGVERAQAGVGGVPRGRRRLGQAVLGRQEAQLQVGRTAAPAMGEGRRRGRGGEGGGVGGAPEGEDLLDDVGFLGRGIEALDAVGVEVLVQDLEQKQTDIFGMLI